MLGYYFKEKGTPEPPGAYPTRQGHIPHSQIGHNFFSNLLTCEVLYLIEVLEFMAQMWQYIIFLSLKPIKASSDFILNYLKKKLVEGATTQIYQKHDSFTIWKRP